MTGRPWTEMEPSLAANRIELQEGADSSSSERSLDEQNPIGLGQASRIGRQMIAECDSPDNQGEDVTVSQAGQGL
jgi:hypothetical protein